ncbi:Heat shock 70 kDa protein 12A [Mortierella sp. AM989]|nr:Heat shock 70 kDa protein 12A [Mortierella sp. AM989]
MSSQSNTSYAIQKPPSTSNSTTSPTGNGTQRPSQRKMAAGTSPLTSSPLASEALRPSTRIKPKPEMPTTLPPESVCECFICHAASPYSQQPPPEIPVNQRHELLRDKYVYLSPNSSRAHDHLIASRAPTSGSNGDMTYDPDNKVRCMVLTFAALGRAYDVPPSNEKMKRPPKGMDIVRRQCEVGSNSTDSLDSTTGEEYGVFAADALVPLVMVLYKKKKKSASKAIGNENASTNSIESANTPSQESGIDKNAHVKVDIAANSAKSNAQPQNTGSTRQPSHPQLVGDTPLISTFFNEDPRSPHTVTTTAGNSAFPPAYSSIISNGQSIHVASAPSHDAVSSSNPSTPTTSMAQAYPSPSQAYPSPSQTYPSPSQTYPSPSQTYPSPSQATTPSPLNTNSGPVSYSNSPLPPLPNNAAYQLPPQPTIPMTQMAYPVPGQTAAWPPYQQYPPPNTSQHYNHVPYAIPGNQNQRYPIIMAIDWGTTYSSMAYAYQQDGEVHEVSTWPKQSHNYPKVPTCNLYAPGSKEILEWGYPAKIAMSKPPYKNHTLLSKYKLHLDESSGPHHPLPNGLTVVDAIADYLRLFHAHVVSSALRGFGSAFEQQHIQYCLSVPAMWTDHAKSLMRQAALQAGMISPLDPPHRLLLISEPEAAALYCEKKCDQFAIGHGERFMICDAGGGTVDLIVFEVAVGPQGRTLREVTRGSGHSCGSIFLDERMEALLRRRFASWKENGLTPTNWVQLMESFIHNVKPLFDGLEDQYITMPAIPGRAELTDYDIDLEDGVLKVSAEEMRREVFDPVVDDVLRLIQHQLQQTSFNCQAIFLVGGFGCSGYLLARVRQEFASMVRLIAIPPRPELAVVRGAALAGITPRVVAARVARRWYGVDSLMAFENGVDMPHKQVRDHEGQVRARDRFSVYVIPGQQIGVDECISKRYVTYQYPRPVNSPLYACSSMTMPRYVDSPMVEKIGDFTIPLPFIPGAVPGHRVTFELRMYFGATEIRAEAEVNGVVVSTRCQFTG